MRKAVTSYATNILLFSALLFFEKQPLASEIFTVNQIEVDLIHPLESDEKEELVQFLSSFMGSNADASTAQLAYNQLLELKRYRNVDCHIVQKDTMAVLTCQMEHIPVIRSIHIQNLPLAILQSELEKRVQLKVGEPLDIHNDDVVSNLNRLKKRIVGFLEHEGFWGANIRVFLAQHPESPQTDIYISIEGGAFIRVHQVNVKDSGPLSPKLIRDTFSRMCFTFQDGFDAILGKSYACYSKEKEQEGTEYLQKLLSEKGYFSSSLKVTKKIIDPFNSQSSRRCKASEAETKYYSEQTSIRFYKCVDLEVEVIEGPRIETDIQIIQGQKLWLNSAGTFFRSLFGIEFLSRALNSSLIGAQFPADETILINQLEKGLTFSYNHIVDEKEITTSTANMLHILKSRGYLNASIEPEIITKTSQLIHIRFNVYPGMPSAVTALHFTGNLFFSYQQLIEKTQLSLLPRGGNSSGHLTQQLVDEDLEKIKALYLSKGFSKIQVIATADYSDTGNITLDYHIEEGPRQVVHSIDFLNGRPELEASLLPLLYNKKNEGFLPELLEEDKHVIQEFYANKGYPYITVESKVNYITGSSPIQITFNIINTQTPSSSPLEPVKIGSTLINGNIKTLSAPILRDMGADLTKEGAVFSPSALLGGINHLRQGRVFSRINVDYVGLQEKRNTIYPLINIVERPSLTIDTGLMFSTDNLFALELQTRERNLLGTMTEIDTKIEWGLFIGLRSAIKNNFYWPRIWGENVDLNLNIPSIQYYDRLNRAIKERHLELKAGPRFTFNITPNFNIFMEYRFRLDFWQENFSPVSLFINPKEDLKTLDGLLVVLRNPPSARHVLEPGLAYINIDNPFNPKQGIKLRAFTQYSGFLMGGKPPYTIFGLQTTGYISLGPFTLVGQVIGRYALIPEPQTTWWVIKYESDMDTLGGDQTIRGYYEGTIGVYGEIKDQYGNVLPDPKKNGAPLMGIHPGNFIVQGNVEIRFPLVPKLIIGSDLDGVIFTDLGYEGICLNGFRCTNDSTNYGLSVGLGLRLLLPPGPIVVDYAVSPITNGDGIFSKTSRFHFMFGYPF